MSKPHYVTNDPYLASFLLSEGAVLVSYRRLAPKTVQFCLVADERLHHLLRLYWSGRPTTAVPSRLFGVLRRLKARTPFNG